MLKKAAITEIFARLAAKNPAPRTELNAPNDFCLLIAIVLSAQATDISVNKATSELFQVANTPEALLELGETKVKQYIKTIGLFNSKAKNIIKLCETLLNDYAGIIPKDRDELQKLAGVGRKTANVWINCVHGIPLIAVDTHVFRVGNRLKLTKASNVLQCEEQLEKRIPKQYLRGAHDWLILHGRYVCKARTPECYRCDLMDLCQFKGKTQKTAK
jgi:endonuclease III